MTGLVKNVLTQKRFYRVIGLFVMQWRIIEDIIEARGRVEGYSLWLRLCNVSKRYMDKSVMSHKQNNCLWITKGVLKYNELKVYEEVGYKFMQGAVKSWV